VLFGTGAGITFFFLRAQRSGDSRIVAAASQDVVLADMVFTATAVVLQPVTSIALALMARYPLSTHWLVLSMVLYGLVGCCWLPVVWLQMRMRDLAVDATHRGQPLPVQYEIYHRRRFPTSLINDARLGFDTRGFAAWLLARPEVAQGRANHFDLCAALLLVQNSGMAESGGSTSVQWSGPLNEYVGSATASFVG
jgi:uncharacterized membrane protein